MRAGETIPVLNKAEDDRLVDVLNKISTVQKWTIKNNMIICENQKDESK